LLRALPRPILQLAFPGRQIEPLGPLDPSVDRSRQLTTDNLFRVRDHTVEAAVHVEVEREWRPELPRRLFEYATAAMTATRLPVGTVLVLVRRGEPPPQGIGVYRVPGIEGDAVVFRYHVVPLWQLDARQMKAELGLSGAPFCAAMRGADEKFVSALADEVRSDRTLAESDRTSTMQLLLLVSAAILGSDAARRIFHMESLIQDPSVQALIAEWEDKGLAKGRAEGHVEGLRVALYRVLSARSFQVTSDVQVRIDREPDAARIEVWLDAAVTAGSIGDVFRDG
jgi:hypothetical protein